MSPSPMAQKILDGDVRMAGRLMRHVDDDFHTARPILEELFAYTGHARIIGVTGNPGSGKSTLVDQLIHVMRTRGRRVGCVAVDPTSPFSGGAILGDRVRMQRHALDRDVFIRSVATRGNLGGISRSTPAIVQILDAMGFDYIIIETVGVGQDEVDIVRLADTSVVVSVPGLGDDVQAAKAGIMEIADVFAINKADRPGVDRLKRELRTMIEMGEREEGEWRPLVVETIAPKGEGVEALLDAIESHLAHIDERGGATRIERERLAHYVRLIALGQIEKKIDAHVSTTQWSRDLERVRKREIGPHDAALRLIAALGIEM